MQANYQYIVERSANLVSAQNAVVLDYGCGSGDIVEALRASGRRAYGVELFYEGSNAREGAEAKGLLGDAVLELDGGGRIPFEDDSFDLVVSNQVFEHVEALDNVVAEIARVLKPGGRLLCLFPTLGVVREVHCGVPIVHWLPDNRIRYYWLLLFRTLGLGYHKEDKTRRQWAADFTDWLRRYTHYRSRRAVRLALGAVFEHYTSLEDNYCAYRLQRKGLYRSAAIASWPLLRLVTREGCRCWGGLIFTMQKRV